MTDGDANDAAPAWSADGSRVAFSRTRSGIADYNLSDIWVAGADGSNARQITSETGRAIFPSWSPDGSALACFGTDEQEPEIGDPHRESG